MKIGFFFKKRREEKYLKELQEICLAIGCSGISKSCKTHTQNCQIIRKIMETK